MCRVGLTSRLITMIDRLASMVRRHLPTPSPSVPSRPGAPVSSSSVQIVHDAPAGMETRTAPPGDVPKSSTPVTATSASDLPGLINCSRLCCSRLLPGLKMATRCSFPWPGATLFSAVRKPSGVRTYASTSMSSALDSVKRQSPAPDPVRPDSPFAVLPRCRSSELKWTVAAAPTDRSTGPNQRPVSSKASIAISPGTSE